MITYSNTHSGPEKYPLPDVAVIVCGRCKDRFRLTILVARKNIGVLVCPHCGNAITVKPTNKTALSPTGQGCLVGRFSFHPTPTITTHHTPLT